MRSKSPEALSGKTILVALVHLDDDERPASQEQFLGTIIQIQETSSPVPGLLIRRPDGTVVCLPYVLHTIRIAPRGTYVLASSGEKIVNPDFLALWSRSGKPEPDGSFLLYPIHPDPYVSGIPRQWVHEYRIDPEFLQSLIRETADEYLGKSVIIGITEMASRSQRQLTGTISRISYQVGVVVDLVSRGEYRLPPDLSLLIPAPPGEYRLRKTGEMVRDPDFLVYLTMSRGEPAEPTSG